MNILKKMLSMMTSQINKSDVIIPQKAVPHKIQDNDQSIHNGVINEKREPTLRGDSKPKAGRKRKPKS